ncbi:MAG: T9SS type A sorting domain-containing protein [Flammeovirgaceae bacterium]
MKLKLIFFTLLSVLLFEQVQAQQLERVVINSTGGQFSSSNHSIESNVGELVGITLQNSTITLTQGFLQPILPIPTSLETLHQELGFSYYPNPASYAFTLESEVPHKIQQVVFYDMAGKLAKRIEFGQQQLNIESLQYGFYLVQALDRQGSPIHSFKLLKQ